MVSFMTKNRKYVLAILLVMILLIFAVRVTYALFEASILNTGSLTGDTCFSIKYTNGQAISGELSMGSGYSSGKSTNIVLHIDNQTEDSKCSNIIGKGTIYLNTVSSNVDFSTSGSIPLMYSVLVGNTVMVSGEVNGNSKQAIYTGFNVTTTSVTYKVYLWYNEDKDNVNDFNDINYSGYISAEVIAESTIKNN